MVIGGGLSEYTPPHNSMLDVSAPMVDVSAPMVDVSAPMVTRSYHFWRYPSLLLHATTTPCDAPPITDSLPATPVSCHNRSPASPATSPTGCTGRIIV